VSYKPIELLVSKSKTTSCAPLDCEDISVGAALAKVVPKNGVEKENMIHTIIAKKVPKCCPYLFMQTPTF
jgi:hypothetical protein